MKIKYQFATETIEVEVTDDWGNLVIDLDRLEYNNDHKETRRHVSYDALDFDGDAMATEDPTLTTYTEQDELRQAIQRLTPNQQYIIRSYYFEG
ncbi:MAG: sigma-70 family RNA polymerase sigma factor, partial [Faecousia sp.]